MGWGRGDWFWLGSAPLADRSIPWQIPACIGDGTDYTIHLSGWPGCGAANIDVISEAFQVVESVPRPVLAVTSPNGSEVWQAGTAQLITWQTSNPVGQVDVWLIDQDVQGDTLWLGSASMEDGQLLWDMCPYVGNGSGYAVRVESCVCGPCVSDQSDASFQITGSRELPPLLGDYNGNAALDLLDYSQLVNCFTGPAFAQAASVAAIPMPQCGCELFDWEHDGDVDLRDVAELQRCFSSP